MSETDWARSWPAARGPPPPPPPPPPPAGLPRGGEAFMPEANEKEGRDPAATLLSARDLSCSDQLNPWSERAAEGLEPALGLIALLA